MERVVAPHGPHIPIDMVYTYVDGDDPAHLEKRRAYEKIFIQGEETPVFVSDSNSEIRYRNVGEITFSVRSVLKYLPWVRKIFIITDSQMPPVDRELLESPRVRIVDHSEIIPGEYLPTFNTFVIESLMHRISGLSEIFLYNNDDFMHFSPVSHAFFFDSSSEVLNLHAYCALKRHISRRICELFPWYPLKINLHTISISNAFSMLRRSRYALSWKEIIVPAHATNVYRRSTALRLEDEFKSELDANRRQRFRSIRRFSYNTLMYSLELKWNPNDKIHAIFGPKHSKDFCVYDFTGIPGRDRELWKKAEASSAGLVCLNNIPCSEKDRFLELMKMKGLCEPLRPGS